MYSSTAIGSPQFVVGNAVHHFLSLWDCGLCPSLNFATNSDGHIGVSLNVTYSPPSAQNLFPCSPRRRSGKASRRRRRERRKPQDNAVENAIAACNDNCEDESYQSSRSADKPVALEAADFPLESSRPDEEFSHDDISCPNGSESNDAMNSFKTQDPIPCILYVEGCRNIVSEYFNMYTAICDKCVAYMTKKLQSSHFFAEGEPLSLCVDCTEEIHQDGYAESRWGSWHLDETSGKIV